jgi:hypothetical protein
MTPTEALAMLDAMTPSEFVRSKMNPSFSVLQMHTIIRDGIIDIQKRSDRPLDHLMEKRVWQCVRNQRKPRF